MNGRQYIRRQGCHYMSIDSRVEGLTLDIAYILSIFDLALKYSIYHPLFCRTLRSTLSTLYKGEQLCNLANENHAVLLTATYTRLTTAMCIKWCQCHLPACMVSYGCKDLGCSPSMSVLISAVIFSFLHVTQACHQNHCQWQKLLSTCKG